MVVDLSERKPCRDGLVQEQAIANRQDELDRALRLLASGDGPFTLVPLPAHGRP